MKKVILSLFLAAFAAVTVSSCGSEGSISYNVETDLIPVSKDGKWLYIDHNGDVAIQPQFSEASFFIGGLARVRDESGLYGFINKKGEYVIDPVYSHALHFTDGVAWVMKPDGWLPTLIDRKGSVLLTKNDVQAVYAFSDGLALFSNGEGNYGYMDKSGNVVIEPQYRYAKPFKNGRAAVAAPYYFSCQIIDKTGKLVGENVFDNISLSNNGFGVVELAGNKWGIVDRYGNYVIYPQDKFRIICADCDLFIIEQDDKYGWCDNTGKIIITPQFTEIDYFNGTDMAPVYIKTEAECGWGYIDRSGKIIIKPQFNSALSFMGNIAPVEDSSRLFGFIDRTGKWAIKPQYESIGYYYEILFFEPCIWHSQDDIPHPPGAYVYPLRFEDMDEEEIFYYAIVEEKPMFNGKDAEVSFSEWVNSVLVYPPVARENDITGRVFTDFIIDKDGNLTDIRILRGADPLLDAEALRMLRMSPKWTPGKQRGKTVKVRYQFMFVFF